MSQVTRDRMRQNVLKLYRGRLKTDIRRRFFIGRVIKHWNRLPKVMVESPSMEMLRKKKKKSVKSVVVALGTRYNGEHCSAGLT